MRKIIITGPESTGKSYLTEKLSNHFRSTWVKEYAREYLESLNHPYNLEDVLKMAKMQIKKEKEAELETDQFLFVDTDLTVFKIWIKVKYNLELDWIERAINLSQDKIFFLCDVDIPWQPDALREHPNVKDRKELFNQYIELFKKHGLEYHIISGDMNTRLKKCIEIIDNLN